MANKAVGLLTFNFTANLSDFNKKMDRASAKLSKFGKKMQRNGQNMTRNFTAPLVGLAAISLKTFADFEQSMLKVQSVSGATGAELDALTNNAKKLGAATMFSATQVADLQFELSKLGFNPKEINDATESILSLAQATSTDLAEAGRISAVALNSFNLSTEETSRIVDIMALASSSAAIDMEKFGVALPKVGATARIAGDSFEEMTAKLQVLADSGMEGSTIGTHLKIIYTRLAKSGLTWDQAMEKIRKSTNKLSTAQDLFGKNAGNTAIILSENTDKLQEYEQANLNAAGSSDRMSSIMDSGLGGTLRRLKSQLEGAAIEIGESLAPAFEKLISKISGLVKWFTSLSTSQKESILKWAGVLAAVGPVLILVGQLSISLGGLAKAFGVVSKLIMANPYLALGAAILIIADAVYAWATANDEVSDSQKSINSIESIAIKSIMVKKKEVEDLTDVINDETTSLEDKEKALEDLKKISPEYYNTFDTIEGNINAITSATNNYTAALLAQAKVEATKSKITELYTQGYEFLESKGQTAAEALDSWDRMLSTGGDFRGGKGKFTTYFTDKDTNDAINKIRDSYLLLINAQKETIKQAEKFKNTIESTDIVPDSDTDPDTDPDFDGNNRGKIKQLSLDVITPTLASPISTDFSLAESFLIPETIFEKIDRLMGKTKELNELGTISEQIWTQAMSALGNELSAGADTFEEFGETIKGVIKDTIGALISQGVAAAIANSLKDSFLPVWAIPVVAGAAAGLARTAFNSLIPTFADGGIVSGPTLGLMGEYPGASSNPEVIAPLDKLKSMIGGGQPVEVFGTISGTDIFLSNNKTSINRLRIT